MHITGSPSSRKSSFSHAKLDRRPIYISRIPWYTFKNTSRSCVMQYLLHLLHHRLSYQFLGATTENTSWKLTFVWLLASAKPLFLNMTLATGGPGLPSYMSHYLTNSHWTRTCLLTLNIHTRNGGKV